MVQIKVPTLNAHVLREHCVRFSFQTRDKTRHKSRLILAFYFIDVVDPGDVVDFAECGTTSETKEPEPKSNMTFRFT